MVDYKAGIKKEVAEVKFLIHDLRVERFINEVIHFHVTLNTDLEIYGVDQAQVIHSEDLLELKSKAVDLRKAYRNYSNAVKNFSPDNTILLTGTNYIEALLDTCSLILNPRWGRINKVLSFLPEESRSVRSRSHYRNCIRWIWGVRSRIEHFLDEKENKDAVDQFDIAEDIQYFTRNVIYPYVTEKSSARVEIQLDQLDSVVLRGSRHRFRRMLFNLVMNSVDAMRHKKVGLLNISAIVEGDRVVLRVSDNGTGIAPEKIEQLLSDKESLDGELHSLGFVFVRQTVTEFNGNLSIESALGVGTEVIISLPYIPDGKPSPLRFSRLREESYQKESIPAIESEETSRSDAEQKERDHSGPGEADSWGKIILSDYSRSESEYPGSIFAISVNAADEVDFFIHQPYERHWNITHEDLSPMLFEATVRGRLEEDDEKKPVLILKAPQNALEYFEFKKIPADYRNPELFVDMVHDEYIRIARKLLETGLSPDMDVHLTGAKKFLANCPDLAEIDPFPLELLAKQSLNSEHS
jgi:hypothetical protein